MPRATRLVNTNAETATRLMEVCWTAVLYEEMEAVWPSGVALREEAPNHPEVRWLMTVVLSVVGKGAA